MSLIVKPENRDKFEKAMVKWKTLIDVIGWYDLCEMYVNKIPPFQDRQEIEDNDSHEGDIRDAKMAILRMIGDDLRDNGLEGNLI